MDILGADHLRCGADDVDVAPPEGFPWCSPFRESEYEELGGPQ